MVPTQNPTAAWLAKQIITGCLLLGGLEAQGAPCLSSFALLGHAQTGASRLGSGVWLRCDSVELRASGHLLEKSREKGAVSVSAAGPAGIFTAGSQILPFETSFLADSWAVLDAPLRTKRTVFAAPDLRGLRPGLFGLQGSRRPGVFLSAEQFFFALHPETGLGALAVRSRSPFHHLILDVTRLRDADHRLTTEGYGSLQIEPLWKFDLEAERRMSWDLTPASSREQRAVDQTRRGRSGLLSAGAEGDWLRFEAGGQDRERFGMRAIQGTAALFAGDWILGPVFSLRGYELRQYGTETARRRDSAAAIGPALRTEHLKVELTGEFRKRGAPAGELRLTWQNRVLSAGLTAFASAVKKGRPADVHMLRDGSPGRASRRFYLEESAGMVLSLNAKWLYVYASAGRTGTKSSLYLHGEGRFEL